MARDNESGNGVNAPIITMNSGRSELPRNLLDAISEIQQFYVIELKGKNIPAEFFTLAQTLDFFKIGVRSGFYEGLTLLLLFPIFQFYLIPFVFAQLDFFSRLLFRTIPYLALIINTGICCYLSRYYIGNITRKGINSLLLGRVMALLVKAFLVYVAYFFLVQISTPDHVWQAVGHCGRWAESLYYGFFVIKPYLLPVATESALLMVMAAVFPYGSVYLLDLWLRGQRKRQARVVSIRSN